MSKSIASIAIEKQDTMAEISYMRTIRTQVSTTDEK